MFRPSITRQKTQDVRFFLRLRSRSQRTPDPDVTLRSGLVIISRRNKPSRIPRRGAIPAVAAALISSIGKLLEGKGHCSLKAWGYADGRRPEDLRPTSPGQDVRARTYRHFI